MVGGDIKSDVFHLAQVVGRGSQMCFCSSKLNSSYKVWTSVTLLGFVFLFSISINLMVLIYLNCRLTLIIWLERHLVDSVD